MLLQFQSSTRHCDNFWVVVKVGSNLPHSIRSIAYRGPPAEIVRYFEIIKERRPDLELPFEKTKLQNIYKQDTKGVKAKEAY